MKPAPSSLIARWPLWKKTAVCLLSATVTVVALTSFRRQYVTERERQRYADLVSAEPLHTSRNDIFNVLPPDAIPAIAKPKFVSVKRAQIAAQSPMIAVTIGGETHAYSLHLLDGHEIVNDRIGDKPIATTW